jgi:hypothetical protein
MQVAAGMQSVIIVVCLFRKTKAICAKLKRPEPFARRAMSIKLQPRDEGEPPQSGRALDAASTESEMNVGGLQQADIQPTAAPNRRLRNWLLFGNATAWILIIIVLRWLLF